MSQPSLTWTLNWGTNLAQKLSGKIFTKPDGTYVDCSRVSGTVTPLVNAKQIYITSVKNDRNYGFINDILVDISGTAPTGHLIADITSATKDTAYSFNISTTSHLTEGEGIYRIGLYIQNYDGYWNYEYFLIAYGNYSLKDVNQNFLQVPVRTS